MQRPQTKIRFSTKAQKDKIIKAAKLHRWSLNTFVVEAATKMADQSLDQELYKQALAAKGEEGLPA